MDIMEFLIFWLGTSIASFVMQIANEMRLFRDAADAGYKIDINRFADLGKQLNPNAPKLTVLSMLIPGFNIIEVFKTTVEYNNVRPMVIDQLRVMNVLEAMSEIEKTQYLKKPTSLNALLIILKSKTNLNEVTLITINDGNQKSEIFYEIGESLDDITIFKVYGPMAKLTVEEQKKKIIEALNRVTENKIEKCGDEKSLINELSNNDKLVLSDDKDKETTSQPTIKVQKEVLEDFKNELLNKILYERDDKKSKGSSLTRRKK